MIEAACERLREQLALGEPIGDTRHRESCAACSREARGMERLFADLAEAVEVEPPASLDASIREWFAAGGAPRPVLSPAPALSLAALWIGAFGATLTFALAATGIADRAPVIALLLVAGFLVFSAASVLPVLFLRFSRDVTHQLEVNR